MHRLSKALHSPINPAKPLLLPDIIAHNIAKELVLAFRKNATIEWTVKESARANLRVIVRRMIAKIRPSAG